MDIQQLMHLESEHSDDNSMSDASTADHRDASGASTASGEVGIGQDETKAVDRAKFLAYKVLLLTAAAIGTAMFFFVSGNEQDDFESQVSYVLPRSSMQPTG
jgi:hypothetical protein